MTTKFGLKKPETSFYRVLYNICIDILNLLGKDYKCDGRTNGQTSCC